jgi:hypothetical protein
VDSTTIAVLHVALDRSMASERVLQSSVDTLVPALTALRAASTTLIHADAKLAAHRKWTAFLPRPSIGETAGFDQSGKPHLITGIALGWSF